MSKQHRTAGVDYKVITIGDHKYTMRPLTVGAYAEMESFIVSQRPDPLEIASAAIGKLPKSQHEAIWKAAMNQAINARTVTAEEATLFENSVDGLSWKVWQCLKQDHEDIDSISAARDLILQAGEEQFERIARATEIASGEAELKKSSGQAATVAEAAPAGPSSTVDSPKPTDGDHDKSTN